MADINIDLAPEPDDPEIIEDDVDELVTLVNEVKATGENQTEILGRIESCLNRLEALSTTQTESPVLVEIKSQLEEMRAELALVKSSVDTLPKSPPLNESIPIAIPALETVDEPEAVDLTEEVPDGSVENPEPIQRARPRRFV